VRFETSLDGTASGRGLFVRGGGDSSDVNCAFAHLPPAAASGKEQDCAGEGVQTEISRAGHERGQYHRRAMHCRLVALVMALVSFSFSGPMVASADVCDADVDGSGSVLGGDLSAYLMCQGLQPAGECAAADVNCDGVINGCDLAVIQCAQNTSNDGSCCETVRCGSCVDESGCAIGAAVQCAERGQVFTECGRCESGDVLPASCGPAPACRCNPDVDGDGGNGLDDTAQILDCIAEGDRPECANADINCDLTIDLCDADIHILTVGVSGDMPEVCAAAVCAPCVIDGVCEQRESGTCADRGGEVLPPGAACPGAAPDVPHFRGGGGCECGAVGAAPAPGLAWFGLVAFATVRLRRRLSPRSQASGSGAAR